MGTKSQALGYNPWGLIIRTWGWSLFPGGGLKHCIFITLSFGKNRLWIWGIFILYANITKGFKGIPDLAQVPCVACRWRRWLKWPSGNSCPVFVLSYISSVGIRRYLGDDYLDHIADHIKEAPCEIIILVKKRDDPVGWGQKIVD